MAKRYNIMPNGEPLEHPNGSWHRSCDYAALETKYTHQVLDWQKSLTKRVELEAEMDALKKKFNAYKGLVSGLVGCLPRKDLIKIEAVLRKSLESEAKDGD